MNPLYGNSPYMGWGWFLWLGMIVLIFSSVGNWGYTYSAHRRSRHILTRHGALDALAERYARGEITREEFHRVREEILALLNSSVGSVIRPVATHVINKPAHSV